MTATINAVSALSLDADGVEEWSKAAEVQTHGRSTIKLLTCAVVRTILTDLDAPLTVTGEDTGRAGIINAADVVTVSDLIHAAMLPSDARAILCLQRHSAAALATDVSSFLLHMHTWAAANVGWSGHVITDSGGFGTTNRFTAREIANLLRWVKANDPWLYDTSAKLTHDVSITGGRTATVPITHTAAPAGVPIVPEFISGKTGSDGTTPTSDAAIVLTWEHPDSTTHTLAVMGSTIANRAADVRAILDDVIAATSPSRRGASAVAFL